MGRSNENSFFCSFAAIGNERGFSSSSIIPPIAGIIPSSIIPPIAGIIPGRVKYEKYTNHIGICHLRLKMMCITNGSPGP